MARRTQDCEELNFPMAEPAQDRSTTVPSLARSIATGAIGFGLISLGVFATVAFAERLMYQRLGLFSAYLTWTVLFIMLSGAVFGQLTVVRWRLPGFYLLFALAFFAYAAAWMLAYFTLRNTVGEFIGSLAGSALMALVFAGGFGSLKSTVKLSAVLFVSNCLGYFLGSALNNSFGGRLGMLLWGVAYGLFFGAGIGAALQIIQVDTETRTA
jgi:hypothetical protein